MIKIRDKIKLLYFASHPIQYNIGLFKTLAKNKIFNFKVIFEDQVGLTPMYIKGFNKLIQWDINLLGGYNYKFIKNYSTNPMGKFFARINPSIISLLIQEKPSFVILHGYMYLSDWILYIMARLLNIKIIFKGEAVLKENQFKRSWKNIFKKFILSHFLKNCHRVLYSCTGNKKYWEYYGVQEKKLLFAPCAVDNGFFQLKSIENRSKKKVNKDILGINEGDLVVLFVAQFISRKRPLDLLYAVKTIEHKNIIILFVGDGDERKIMEEYVKQYNLKAKFVGFKNQSELPFYYSISDLAVVISDHDPSPKVMNEAMNFELPIIVTDVVGTAYDLVKENENGYIVKVGDIKNISQKIDYLNKNRVITKNMGKKSLEVINEWTFEKDAECIEKAITM